MKRLFCKLKLFSFITPFLPALFLSPVCFAEEVSPAIREYQLKAIFLFNFTKFTVWPDSTFPTDTSPILLCVLGEDPFQGRLSAILKDSAFKGRSPETRYLQTVETAKDCHILFVSGSEKNNLKTIFSFLQAYPILTVSEIENFVKSGGMIEFYNRESKVRFFIDPQTVKESGLEISSRLLQIADVRHK